MSEEIRRAAGFVLARRGAKDGWEFLLLRNARHGTWGFPKGHCEAGEDELACARRELEEETGIADAAIVADFRLASRYRVTEGDARWWKEVVYRLALTEGDHRLSPEHAEARWAGLEEALEILSWPDSRRILVAAHAKLTEKPDERA